MAEQLERQTAQEAEQPTAQPTASPSSPRRPWLWRMRRLPQRLAAATVGLGMAALATAAAASATFSVTPVLEPRNLREAMASPEWPQWEAAMQAEMKQHQAYGTYEELPATAPLPEPNRLLGSRWVFALKRGPGGVVLRYKARWVIQGFSQLPGVDFGDVTAPVLEPDTQRFLLRLTALFDCECDVVDVDVAFLNSPLEETLFTRPPPGVPGFADRGVRALRLKKAIYGLRQAGRNWHDTLSAFFLAAGFHRSSADPCLFLRCLTAAEAAGSSGGLQMIAVGVYVDDMLIVSPSAAAVASFKAALAARFAIKDLGPVSRVLGLDVTRDRSAGTMRIAQPAIVASLLADFGMTAAPVASTPSARSVELRADQSPRTLAEKEEMAPFVERYRELVGRLPA
jgi:hypothetical protein